MFIPCFCSILSISYSIYLCFHNHFMFIPCVCSILSVNCSIYPRFHVHFHVHSNFIPCSFQVNSIFIACAFHVHCMLSECLVHVLSKFIPCPFHIIIFIPRYHVHSLLWYLLITPSILWVRIHPSVLLSTCSSTTCVSMSISTYFPSPCPQCHLHIGQKLSESIHSYHSIISHSFNISCSFHSFHSFHFNVSTQKIETLRADSAVPATPRNTFLWVALAKVGLHLWCQIGLATKLDTKKSYLKRK